MIVASRDRDARAALIVMIVVSFGFRRRTKSKKVTVVGVRSLSGARKRESVQDSHETSIERFQ